FDADCGTGQVAVFAASANGILGDLALRLGDSDRPILAFHTGGGDLRVLHCGDPGCTGGNTISSPDPGAGGGGGVALTLDRSLNPVIAHSRGRILHCGNPNCSSGNTIGTASTGTLSGESIALDSRGRPVVSFMSGTEARVLRCANPSCLGSAGPGASASSI